MYLCTSCFYKTKFFTWVWFSTWIEIDLMESWSPPANFGIFLEKILPKRSWVIAASKFSLAKSVWKICKYSEMLEWCSVTLFFYNNIKHTKVDSAEHLNIKFADQISIQSVTDWLKLKYYCKFIHKPFVKLLGLWLSCLKPEIVMFCLIFYKTWQMKK